MVNDTDKKEKKAGEPTEDVVGRTHNSQNPAVENTGAEGDISRVDRQEGNLEHGETGGHALKKDDQA